MSISAKELAKKLNISPATVSMVLNNKPGISEKTRTLVMDAAREYGYHFSKKAEAAFQKGRIQFVTYKKQGTIVADTPFWVTEGVEYGCKTAGYELLVTYFHEDSDIDTQIRMLAEKNCSGILLLGTELSEKDFRPFSRLNIPIVVLDTYFEELNCDCVLINNVQGAYTATSYLISRGFSEVGYLRSSYSIGNFEERADGYYKALRHHGISTGHPYAHRLAPSIDGAYQDMRKLLADAPSLAPAYFADNDLIAAGAMRALKEYGYRIPEDISIIGFDGSSICDVLEPPLTSMAVPRPRLGELGVERLISKICHSDSTVVKMEVTPWLREGKSVAK